MEMVLPVSGRWEKTNGVGRIREYFARFYFNVAGHVFLKILPWKGEKALSAIEGAGFPKGEKMVDSAFASGFGKLCRSSCLAVIKGLMCNTIAHPPYGLAMGMGFAGFRSKGKNKWRRADTRIFCAVLFQCCEVCLFENFAMERGVGRIRGYFVRFYLILRGMYF